MLISMRRDLIRATTNIAKLIFYAYNNEPIQKELLKLIEFIQDLQEKEWKDTDERYIVLEKEFLISRNIKVCQLTEEFIEEQYKNIHELQKKSNYLMDNKKLKSWLRAIRDFAISVIEVLKEEQKENQRLRNKILRLNTIISVKDSIKERNTQCSQ